MSRFNKIIFIGMVCIFSGFIARAQDSVLTIQEALSYAIENNFDVRISRNETDIDKIMNSWSFAGALPFISASANKTIASNNLQQKLSTGTVIEKKGNNSQNFNAGLSVEWKVFDGLKMFATKRRLEELQRYGEHAFRKTLNELSYQVITSYFNIVLLSEQRQATEEQIELYKDRLNLAQRRFEIGTGAKYEVLEAQVDLNEQYAGLLTLQKAIDVAKSSLYNLMGKPAGYNYRIKDTILVHPLPLLPEVQQKIKSQNPDVQMAASQLTILRETRKEIHADGLPSVNLSGFYNFVKSRSSAGFNLFNQTYGPSGSVGIQVPIFNGGIVKKQLEANNIQIRNQKLVMEQTWQDIQTEIQQVYINYNHALKTIELEKDNLKLAAENNMIATERYKKLSITSVELRQIQISYQAAKNRLYNALYQAKLAEATLSLLMGDIADL